MNNRDEAAESLIVVNGMTLTYAESMTIRVALESFAAELIANGLGDDSHGKAMTKAYLKNINSVRGYMYEQS